MMDDAELLLGLRNDPLTQANSIHGAPANAVEHLKWLERLRADDSRQLLIAEENGIPVGSVRIDRLATGSEISYTVSPAHRGKGVGKMMVSLAIELAVRPVTARIKPSNRASKAIAVACRMQFHAVEEGLEVWVLH